jgi:hypothetical protein
VSSFVDAHHVNTLRLSDRARGVDGDRQCDGSVASVVVVRGAREYGDDDGDARATAKRWMCRDAFAWINAPDQRRGCDASSTRDANGIVSERSVEF